MNQLRLGCAFASLALFIGCASSKWNSIEVYGGENFHGDLFLDVAAIPSLNDGDSLQVSAKFCPPSHDSIHIETTGFYELEDTGSGLRPVIIIPAAMILADYNDEHPGLLTFPLGPEDIYQFLDHSKDWKIQVPERRPEAGP